MRNFEIGELKRQLPAHAPYRPGDTVYIRETWGSLLADHPRCKDGRKPMFGDRIVYRADYQWSRGRTGGFVWRPSIHMPEWASRSHALIESVRVERARETTEEDAIAEGIEPSIVGRGLDYLRYRQGFQTFWESLYPGSWIRNDWVWVYELKEVWRA